MPTGLIIAISVVFAIALGIHFYVKLLRLLRWRHRGLYEELGRPRLLMASVDRSCRLQSFIYSRRALQTGDTEFSSTIRVVRIFSAILTLVAIGVVLTLVAMLLAKTIGY